MQLSLKNIKLYFKDDDLNIILVSIITCFFIYNRKLNYYKVIANLV
mgnify:CR=1 FL=1